MSDAILVTAAAVLLLIAFAVLVFQRRREARRATGGSTEPLTEPAFAESLELGLTAGASPAATPAIGDDELVLVPLPNSRAEALVLGSDRALEVLDASGLTKRPSADTPGPLPQLVRSGMAVGGLETTRHAQHGIDSGRIVALSEETMRHLGRGKPVYDHAKNMLGVVRGDKGRIKHVMRLDKMGAQAVVASNAATLAVTAALSQQLAKMEQLLAEINETLQEMVRTTDRKRLASVVGTNNRLFKIAADVRRRGITQYDAMKLAALELPVIVNQLEAEFTFVDILDENFRKLSRPDRVKKLRALTEKKRLDYWLTIRVQADLASTRSDLLNLHWEITQHPDTAPELTEAVREAIRERQARLARIGNTLRELSDPQSLTKLDPLHQLSRFRLGRQRKKMEKILRLHGAVFTAPDQDPYSLAELPASATSVLPNGADGATLATVNEEPVVDPDNSTRSGSVKPAAPVGKPPGWYPDPEHPSRTRYWNGVEWENKFRFPERGR